MKRANVYLTILTLFLVSLCVKAEQTTQESAYVSDELFIYMHSGAGKNYRIVGTITSGSEIKLTGETKNNFTEIVTPKNKTTWVESKYISTAPSLRAVITELNSKLTEHADSLLSAEQELATSQTTVDTLSKNNTDLTKKNKKLEAELVQVKDKLKHQDQEILTQWFFNGAIVLGFGFILGIILPRFTGKKRKSASWS